jgi:precorrin isomerase
MGAERFVLAMGDATMADRVKIPRDLGEHGRRLVRQVVREVTDASMVLTSTEEFWLHSAAE